MVGVRVWFNRLCCIIFRYVSCTSVMDLDNSGPLEKCWHYGIVIIIVFLLCIYCVNILYMLHNTCIGSCGYFY